MSENDGLIAYSQVTVPSKVERDRSDTTLPAICSLALSALVASGQLPSWPSG